MVYKDKTVYKFSKLIICNLCKMLNCSKEYPRFLLETYVVFIGDVTNMTTFPL